MSTIALIDGDIIIHRCAVVFDEPMYQLEHPAEGAYAFDIVNAKRNVKIQIMKIIDDVQADRAIVCLTGPDNFRKKIDPGYKSNRTTRKPILFLELRAWAEASFECFEKATLEADDVMGILATADDVLGFGADDRRVICSIDKDLRTIPGLHWNWDRQNGFFDEVEVIGETAALQQFYRQAIMGDPTDGYSGCPGAGKVAAGKAIPDTMVDEEEMWAAVLAVFKKGGLDEDDAITNARMARILRDCDYDFEKGEPILWTPPASC